MVALNPIRSRMEAPRGGAGFNSNAAGNKVYGSGQHAPNVGGVSDKSGYAKRDKQAEARKEALKARLGRS